MCLVTSAARSSTALVTKHTHGRERLVRGNVEAIRAASRLLDAYEEIWRGRLDRIHALLAEGEDT